MNIPAKSIIKNARYNKYWSWKRLEDHLIYYIPNNLSGSSFIIVLYLEGCQSEDMGVQGDNSCIPF